MLRKIFVFLTNIFFRLMFKIEIINYERFAMLKTGCIVAPNHISLWEPVIIPVVSKRYIYMMAKEELFKSKISNWFFKKVGAFPVKRGRNDLSAIKTSSKLLREGNAVCIFPQGARVKNSEKLKFKSGVAMLAYTAKVPVIPVGIIANFKFRSKVTIVFGEPIYFDELYEKKPTKEELNESTEKLENAVEKIIKKYR